MLLRLRRPHMVLIAQPSFVSDVTATIGLLSVSGNMSQVVASVGNIAVEIEHDHDG